MFLEQVDCSACRLAPRHKRQVGHLPSGWGTVGLFGGGPESSRGFCPWGIIVLGLLDGPLFHVFDPWPTLAALGAAWY